MHANIIHFCDRAAIGLLISTMVFLRHTYWSKHDSNAPVVKSKHESFHSGSYDVSLFPASRALSLFFRLHSPGPAQVMCQSVWHVREGFQSQSRCQILKRSRSSSPTLFSSKDTVPRADCLGGFVSNMSRSGSLVAIHLCRSGVNCSRELLFVRISLQEAPPPHWLKCRGLELPWRTSSLR